MKYNLVATGGTFDLLHVGHREFLKFCLSKSEKIVFGLTSDEYVKKFKAGRNIATYDVRKTAIENFLKEVNAVKRVEIVPISEKYGPTIDPGYNFDALLVTEETREGGEAINTKRQKLGLCALPLEVFSMVTARDGTPINSTRIRNEILLLPPTLRALLQDPFGEVLVDIPLDIDPRKLITVGDITTKKCIDLKIQPFLAIIDHKVERKDIDLHIPFSSKTKRWDVKSLPGTINGEIFGILKQIFDENAANSLITVYGEEDLLVLPTLLCAPIGFTVLYGQPVRLARPSASQVDRGGQGKSVAGRPHAGLVKVLVTNDTKKRAEKIFQQFDIEQPI